MNKFRAKGTAEQYITFKGIEYAFIVRKKRIGVRRMDQKLPSEGIIDVITQYIIAEGWADHMLEDTEEDS
jgi:hypothetical protein